eukprot:scpid85219/ scgid2491/ 
MACVDSSDEEDKSACQVSSTTVILESDISSQASHVTTETRDQAVESTAKNATANSKQGVLPSSKLETTYPSDLECVSENVELKGFTKSSSDAESLSNSKTKAPTVPSLTIRGRVMSDCTQVKKIRKKVVAKFADEAVSTEEHISIIIKIILVRTERSHSPRYLEGRELLRTSQHNSAQCKEKVCHDFEQFPVNCSEVSVLATLRAHQPFSQ